MPLRRTLKRQGCSKVGYILPTIILVLLLIEVVVLRYGEPDPLGGPELGTKTKSRTGQGGRQSYNRPVVSHSVITKIPDSNIYIFSAIMVNSSDDKIWDLVLVNAWISTSTASKLWCCFMYQNRDIEGIKVTRINQRTEMFNQTAQIECVNPNKHTTDFISGVSLSLHEECATESSTYIRPEMALKQHGTFNMAICAKIAYGNLNPGLTIEWFEYNKRMGVSHVFAYSYKLSAQTRSVLKHYENQGFLELRMFDYPRSESPLRHVGEKSTAAWNDEQVTVYDCQARLSGYHYVAVVDFDEFLVPMMDKNFQQMLTRLMSLIPEAGAIDFFGEIYVTDWGPSDRDEELHVKRYQNRTMSHKPIEINQRKVIHIPARTKRGSAVTHGCKVKKGFKIWRDPMAIIGMNHYRRCVDFWEDCYTRTRVRDSRIVQHVRRIIPTVRDLKSKLLQRTIRRQPRLHDIQ